ncbi:MAG: leucine-rich repeat domain-containing protein [Oscillospiraceae bacterium]|nr:leucine-rich repeat domain-containing protein [Oscillospiraceae bacterium]
MKGKLIRGAAGFALALLVVTGCGLLQPAGDFIGSMTVNVAAYETSGNCGKTDTDTVNWALTDEDNDGNYTLTISGSGAMADYEDSNNDRAPWYGSRLDITSLVIGENVTSIGNYAFYEFMNSDLTVTFADNCKLTTIGEGAFLHALFKELDIPDSVTSIGGSAFRSTSFATRIKLPNNEDFTVINDRLFEDCSITELDIPEYVNTVRGQPFYKSKIENLYNYSSTNMRDKGVDNDNIHTLHTLSFTDPGDTGIVEYATAPFKTDAEGDKYMSGKPVTFTARPNGENTIDAFLVNGEAVTPTENGDEYTITMPEENTTVEVIFGDGAIGGNCGAEDSDAVTWALTDEDNDGIRDTLTISGEGAMADYEFANNTSSAPWWAYRKDISNIVIADGVTHIGDTSFYYLGENCDEVNVTLPTSITSIGEYALGYVNIKSIVIPENVVTIGKEAFCATALSEIAIPDTVTSIDEGIFCNCEHLAWVELPENGHITKIPDFMFSSCESLYEVNIPASVTEIGDYAFQICGFESIDIPEGVTSIGARAFAGCKALQTVDIPATVASMGTEVFLNCSALTDIYNYSDALTEYAWPENVTVHTLQPLTVFDLVNASIVVSDLPEDGMMMGGKPVKFTMDADEGCKVSFAYNDGEIDRTVEVTPEDGIYSFNMPDYATTLTAVAEEPNEYANCVGYQLSLNGDIGLNVFFDFTGMVSSNAVMEIVQPNGKKQEISYDHFVYDSERKAYKFTANVAAKEMTKKVKFRLYVDGEEPVMTYKVSVKDAARLYLSRYGKETKEYKVVKSMLDYGAYSQLFFKYNTGDLAAEVDSDAFEDSYGEIRECISDSYDNVLPPEITFYNVSLTLESKTQLNMYFESNSGGFLEFEVFGMEENKYIVKDLGDGKYKLTILDIAPEDLHEPVRVHMHDDVFNLGNVIYSPLRYIYTVLKSHSDDTDLRNVCCALYNYYEAAFSAVTE